MYACVYVCVSVCVCVRVQASPHQQAILVCPRIQLRSDTISPEIARDSTGKKTWLHETILYFRRQLQAQVAPRASD